MKEETTSMDKKGVYSIQIASQSSLKVLYKKLHVLWLIFDEEGPGRGVPRLKNRDLCGLQGHFFCHPHVA